MFKHYIEQSNQKDKAKSLFKYFNNDLQLGYFNARYKAIQFCNEMIEENDEAINWRMVRLYLQNSSYGE